MKKTLIVAALLAASAVATPSFAADAVVVVDDAARPDAVCFVLPLLPDCAAQWHDYWKAQGYHVAMPVEWWTCVKAEAGSGHLLDCDNDA